jgi:hypothetical protein
MKNLQVMGVCVGLIHAVQGLIDHVSQITGHEDWHPETQHSVLELLTQSEMVGFSEGEEAAIRDIAARTVRMVFCGASLSELVPDTSLQ